MKWNRPQHSQAERSKISDLCSESNSFRNTIWFSLCRCRILLHVLEMVWNYFWWKQKPWKPSCNSNVPRLLLCILKLTGVHWGADLLVLTWQSQRAHSHLVESQQPYKWDNEQSKKTNQNLRKKKEILEVIPKDEGGERSDFLLLNWWLKLKEATSCCFVRKKSPERRASIWLRR